MSVRTHALPGIRQCQRLTLSRSPASDPPTPGSETALALLRRMDERHGQDPCAGARMLRDLLRREGPAIGRRPVGTLRRRRGLAAGSRKPPRRRRHPAPQV